MVLMIECSFSLVVEYEIPNLVTRVRFSQAALLFNFIFLIS